MRIANSRSALPVALWIALPVLWGIAVISIYQCADIVRKALAGSMPPGAALFADERALSKKAAALDLSGEIAPYNDQLQIPFRNRYPAAIKLADSSIRNAEAKYHRPVLSLKAILARDKSYAILEDSQLRSYICKEGDIVEGQTVVRISSEEVTMRDQLGQYRLRIRSSLSMQNPK
jgi:hypothetical protein